MLAWSEVVTCAVRVVVSGDEPEAGTALREVENEAPPPEGEQRESEGVIAVQVPLH